MNPLELVGVPGLMALTHGRTDVVVRLLECPVALDRPDLITGNRTLSRGSGACRGSASEACQHRTFVTGILAARRGSRASATAPDCTLLVPPIFTEAGPAGNGARVGLNATTERATREYLLCSAEGALMI
jgi:hypothetical protein